MTETPEPTSQPTTTRKRPGGLAGMLLADLKAMAGGLGVPGAAAMKKAQLVDAIKTAQGGSRDAGRPPAASGSGDAPAAAADRPTRGQARQGRGQRTDAGAAAGDQPGDERGDGRGDGAPPASQRDNQTGSDRVQRERRGGQDGRDQGGRDQGAKDQGAKDQGAKDQGAKDQGAKDQGAKDQGAKDQGAKDQGAKDQGAKEQGAREQGARDQGAREQGARDQTPKDQNAKDRAGNQAGKGPQDQPQQAGNQGNSQAADDADADGDGEGGSRRNRRRRGRDRTRTTTGGPAATGVTATTGGRNEPDTTILDDDVLVPAAGILDVLDNYAFVRTSGYLPGADDVYLSLSMVRKFGLRRGDAVVGQVRQPREGERKEKFNPMVRIDSVNGADPDTARTRPEFTAMTPVHPDQRLRMETGPGDLVGRLVDLAAPIGKGQRALVESPSHAGKTTLLRAVAEAVTRNNPECHLMVVLVDERPEEVTDFQRSVKGEVVASTFDRPPADHTIVAELAIERAKRLVELGHDVVVLLDGLTRLGRAYNLAAPAGGRVLAGGIDAGALFPPKQFFGAARNLEDGGSLTIIATATVESGSALDEVILDELGDTANAEVRLRRDLAEAGVFPAVDLVRSGTRAVDRLVGDQEREILAKLRRVLAGMDGRAAAELLLERVRASQTNVELLTRVQRTAANVV